LNRHDREPNALLYQARAELGATNATVQIARLNGEIDFAPPTRSMIVQGYEEVQSLARMASIIEGGHLDDPAGWVVAVDSLVVGTDALVMKTITGAGHGPRLSAEFAHRLIAREFDQLELHRPDGEEARFDMLQERFSFAGYVALRASAGQAMTEIEPVLLRSLPTEKELPAEVRDVVFDDAGVGL
jgi:hypothetical protein